MSAALRHSYRHVPLPSRTTFLRRLALRWLASAGLITISLGIGVLGYHAFGGLSWMDALLNASMILTGMGPVDPLTTPSAKLFASFYALFSGVAFLTIIAVMMGPIAQRFLHRFHLELQGDDEAPGHQGSRSASSPRARTSPSS